MWLRAIRKGLLSQGLAAVLIALVCGAALDWGHVGGDDPDCDPVLVYHDHTAHNSRLDASRSVPPVDHCYICHSLRLLHNSVAARAAGAVFTLQFTALRHVDTLAASGAVGLARPSRAPPVASV